MCMCVFTIRAFNCQHIDDLLYWEQNLLWVLSHIGELTRWQSLWEHKRDEDEATTCNNHLLALSSCDSDSFPNIHCILVIACTLPITSDEVEQPIPLLRRIKTYTRFTLTEPHYSVLGVLAMNDGERERGSVSVDGIAMLLYSVIHALRRERMPFDGITHAIV